MASELAWGGGRDRPPRALRQWDRPRLGHGQSRRRRLGLVAVARPLFGQGWQSLKTGALPEGAETVSGRSKRTGRRRVPLGSLPPQREAAAGRGGTAARPGPSQRWSTGGSLGGTERERGGRGTGLRRPVLGRTQDRVPVPVGARTESRSLRTAAPPDEAPRGVLQGPTVPACRAQQGRVACVLAGSRRGGGGGRPQRASGSVGAGRGIGEGRARAQGGSLGSLTEASRRQKKSRRGVTKAAS
jgi:hypothetical protein